MAAQLVLERNHNKIFVGGHLFLNTGFRVFSAQLWFVRVSDLSLWNTEGGGSLTARIMSTEQKSSSPAILAITDQAPPTFSAQPMVRGAGGTRDPTAKVSVSFKSNPPAVWLQIVFVCLTLSLPSQSSRVGIWPRLPVARKLEPRPPLGPQPYLHVTMGICWWDLQ